MFPSIVNLQTWVQCYIKPVAWIFQPQWTLSNAFWRFTNVKIAFRLSDGTHLINLLSMKIFAIVDLPGLKPLRFGHRCGLISGQVLFRRFFVCYISCNGLQSNSPVVICLAKTLVMASYRIDQVSHWPSACSDSWDVIQIAIR